MAHSGCRAVSARALAAGLLVASGALGCDACREPAATGGSALDAGPGGLSREAADQVLARVGDRTLRLGDYVAAMERMDVLERLRYQTKERRRALLDEMIQVELLAREAERRGLHDEPETQALIREFQRDEVLRELRSRLPGVESIGADEVSRYYAEHRGDFRLPEMRRAASLSFADRGEASRVLDLARGADAASWRNLAREHAPDQAAALPDDAAARPAETVPGDLGMFAREASHDSERSVAEPLRRAAFAIAAEGEVHPDLVPVDGRFHVVRLLARVPARRQTLSEVETRVRAEIAEARRMKAERELLERLRQTIEVSVDEQALSRLAEPREGPPQ